MSGIKREDLIDGKKPIGPDAEDDLVKRQRRASAAHYVEERQHMASRGMRRSGPERPRTVEECATYEAQVWERNYNQMAEMLEEKEDDVQRLQRAYASLEQSTEFEIARLRELLAKDTELERIRELVYLPWWKRATNWFKKRV